MTATIHAAAPLHLRIRRVRGRMAITSSQGPKAGLWRRRWAYRIPGKSADLSGCNRTSRIDRGASRATPSCDRLRAGPTKCGPLSKHRGRWESPATTTNWASRRMGISASQRQTQWRRPRSHRELLATTSESECVLWRCATAVPPPLGHQCRVDLTCRIRLCTGYRAPFLFSRLPLDAPAWPWRTPQANPRASRRSELPWRRAVARCGRGGVDVVGHRRALHTAGRPAGSRSGQGLSQVDRLGDAPRLGRSVGHFDLPRALEDPAEEPGPFALDPRIVPDPPRLMLDKHQRGEEPVL